MSLSDLLQTRILQFPVVRDVAGHEPDARYRDRGPDDRPCQDVGGPMDVQVHPGESHDTCEAQGQYARLPPVDEYGDRCGERIGRVSGRERERCGRIDDQGEIHDLERPDTADQRLHDDIHDYECHEYGDYDRDPHLPVAVRAREQKGQNEPDSRIRRDEGYRLHRGVQERQCPLDPVQDVQLDHRARRLSALL